MRLKFLIALFGIIVIILIAVLLIRPKNVRPQDETQNTTPKSAIVSTTIETQHPQPITNRVLTMSKEGQEIEKEWESIPKNQSLQTRIEELARRRGVSPEVLTQQMSIEWSNMWHEAVSPTIEFYGKVVDENEMSIQGATVTFKCLSAFPEQLFTTNILTEADGNFMLKNVNASILDVYPQKESYEGTNNQTRFMYGSVANKFQPDQNNPVIFHLRKTN